MFSSFVKTTKSISGSQDLILGHNNVNNFESESYNVFDEQSKLFQLNIKEENLDDDLDNKNNLHSIIGTFAPYLNDVIVV